MRANTLKKLKEGREKMDEVLGQARCIHVCVTTCPRCGVKLRKREHNPRFKCMCGWESNRPNGETV